LSDDYSKTLTSFPAWASKVFTLSRFQQIRAAFHPEVGVSKSGDKVHQLRYALNCLNSASKRAFIPGKDLSFDEGGVATRSKFCPVRMYNQSKPDKFRVEFFMAGNCSKGMYFVIHCDIYQGKNAMNIDIPREIHNLPTTQKAVVNAVIKTGIAMDPEGMRCLFMDNRYQCSELAILLRDSYQILSCGTTRKNRNGWNNDVFTLTVKAERGSIIRKYDPTNELLYLQWKDNKVVNLISTLGVSGITQVQRRIGAEKHMIQCEENIVRYVDKMNGIDIIDYHQKIGGGLARIAHYKKWYKKTHHALCDLMYHNGRVGWNMSCNENRRLRRRELTTWEFHAVLAEELISFVDDRSDEKQSATSESNMIDMIVRGHRPVEIGKPESRKNCCVCRIETNIVKQLEMKKKKKLLEHPTSSLRDQLGWQIDLGATARVQKSLCECSFPECTLVSHVVRSSTNKRLIFTLPEFEGMSCFEIAHALHADGMFKCQPNGTQKVGVRTGHPIWLKLREMYGLREKKRTPKKNNKMRILGGDSDSSESNSSDRDDNDDSSSSSNENAGGSSNESSEHSESMEEI
jgi:hypothetical protein